MSASTTCALVTEGQVSASTFAHRLKEADVQLDDTRSEKLMRHANTRSGTTRHYLEGQALAYKRLRGPYPKKLIGVDSIEPCSE